MFLQRVMLRNFRGFYGDQSIDFAPLGENSVTIIHGENGAGKTNLLNAIFWCLTGEFTPRLNNPEMLLNKAARDEDKEAECFVEVTFRHEDKQYLTRRTVTGRNFTSLEVLPLDDGVGKSFTNPQQFLETIIPKGLSRWFFFDAEAIGELELSGSTQFRQELRKVLGFELVDGLLKDLDRCLSKKQSNLAKVVNSRELDAIQEARVKIEHVLPAQLEKAKVLEQQLSAADARVSRLEAELRNLPKSKPLQDNRGRLDARRKNCVANKKELQGRIARYVGDSAPAVLIASMAAPFQDQLHVKENSGRLPAPFSEQLVEDILRDATCVCGRPVDHGSCEEVKIKSLMRSASTTAFNQRVRSIQYLLKDIEATRETYGASLEDLQRRVEVNDTDIAEIDDQLKEIKRQIDLIDEDSIRTLERERTAAATEARQHSQQLAIINDQVTKNESRLRDLKLQYENTAKKLGHGDAVKKQIDKIKRLGDYITGTLEKQELRALNLLQIELNRILTNYLTKHYSARINPKTYEVELLDAQGRDVGRSTGEGQVLKFAFITAVVAIAGRKTQEKIEFLAEPTVAPLVLDAPFSALDPEYQGSVADNLANQSTQLVLLISSAAWGEAVATALERHVGKRYVIVSRQEGPRGNKPVKTMRINSNLIMLNEYDAERDESVILEF